MNDPVPQPGSDAPRRAGTRLLVVLPSWIGDAVMATPALRLVRLRHPGAFIGALARPGIDALLSDSDLIDEFHVDHVQGVMGPKRAAGKLRPRRYDAALLLTNSFSTALVARLAGIPRRIGYDRDARGLLLTRRLEAPRRADGRFVPVPAVEYYLAVARALDDGRADEPAPRLELGVSARAEARGAEVLRTLGLSEGDPYAILNPGGNNVAKRWPPDRFAAVGRILAERRGWRSVITGAPSELDLAREIARDLPRAIVLAEQAPSLGVLKAIVRGGRVMVTNDTGPRHIAAALGVPVVSLFGPTDHRWTTIPAPAGEEVVVADPTLPPEEVADDHPQRCAVDRITVDRVVQALDRVLGCA